MSFPEKPSEAMRKKRPYLFSDSADFKKIRLSASELSHHLDTLTDRNQHKDFENFCRKICEREICPNIRPQTGPEGGGDGKVDADSFPVDSSISDRWFVGVEDSGDKWAFAFSAKKAWSEKVKSDVSGIAGTGRHYDRIIFVTSRPARSKDRLRIEEDLSREFGARVTILDREWIVDRVLTNSHHDLANTYLGVGEISPDAVQLGPRDYARSQALTEIENAIARLGNSDEDQLQLVSHAFEAARLSRELERPRYETEGRFQRAKKLAKKLGIKSQVLRAVYEHAWTCFWWFDDVESLSELYDEVELLAFEGDVAENVSKVCNLHQVMIGQVNMGEYTHSQLKLDQRSTRLTSKLDELIQDSNRPNNALYAETLKVLNILNFLDVERSVEEQLDEVWEKLSSIIDRAYGLPEFPAELIDSLIKSLSNLMPDSAKFDHLVEKIADFMIERKSEVTAGLFYLDQGERKLGLGKSADGVRWLGRAVVNLLKDETREEQARALHLLANAYRQVDLLWAARSVSLASLAQYLALSDKEGELRVECIAPLYLIALVCLQLGHVNDFLSAVHFLLIFRERSPLTDASKENLDEKLFELDGILSCFLAGLDEKELSRLEQLPDILRYLSLDCAQLVILGRLGQSEPLAEATQSAGLTIAETEEMVSLAALQPASRDLPKRLVSFDDNFDGIVTWVLGVQIQIQAPNSEFGYFHAETYAAALEAFSATLLDRRVFPHTDKLCLVIAATEPGEKCGVKVSENGREIRILVPENWNLIELGRSREYDNHLIESCVHVLLSISTFAEFEKKIEELVKDERVFDRATVFSRAAVGRNRAFGRPLGSLTEWDWLSPKTYSQVRRNTEEKEVSFRPEEASDDPTQHSEWRDAFKGHRDIKVETVINKTLWEQAGWSGVAYGVYGPEFPPLLGLVFADKNKALEIFHEWIERFGEIDENDKIRLSIIKGINARNPYFYRVHLTAKIDVLPGAANLPVVTVSRMHVMTPQDHSNIEMFVDNLEAAGAYWLAPCWVDEAGELKLEIERRILKKDIFILNAWEVGPDDIDAVAISDNDEVLIPENETNPPIADLIAKYKKK
jgi:hypothetical protein